MKPVSKDEALEYINFLPHRNRIDRNGWIFRLIMLLISGITCYLWRTLCPWIAVVCALLSAMALLSSFHRIISALLPEPHVLFSDSIGFLVLSMDLALIAANIFSKVSGDVARGLTIALGMYFLIISAILIYAHRMIKKTLYKPKQSIRPILVMAVLIGVALGCLNALALPAASPADENIITLANAAMMGSFLMSFGLIGFVKYYCFVKFKPAE